MKNPKLVTDLAHLSHPEFSDAVTFIFNLTTRNIALYTGLPVAMGTIEASPPSPAGSFGALIYSWNKIRLGDDYTGKAPDEQAAKNKVQKVVTQNGNWLNTYCNGDLALLKKTGYPLQKEDEAQGQLPATTMQVVSEPGSGKMDFFIQNLKGYRNIRYGIMYTLDTNPEPDPSKWTFYYASQKDGTISGFEIGKSYKFVCFGMGTEKTLTYSDVIVEKAL